MTAPSPRSGWLLALVGPLVLTITAASVANPSQFLPGAWFLIVVIAAGRVGGWRAAALAGLLSVSGLWWTVLDSSPTDAELVALAGFAMLTAGVVVLGSNPARRRPTRCAPASPC